MEAKIAKSKARLIAVLDEYVLVLQKKDGTYSLPGGIVKHRETGVQALLREVKEETGLVLDKNKVKYIATELHSKESKNVYKSYYLYKQKTGKPQNLESDKFKAVKWVKWYDAIDKFDSQDHKVVLDFFSKQPEYIN